MVIMVLGSTRFLVVNPRRACARVTVLGLCVCVCVCVYVCVCTCVCVSVCVSGTTSPATMRNGASNRR